MQNPATPAPIPVQVPAPGSLRPLSQAEIRVIRNHRSEMSSQLSSATDRRNDLVGELREAPAGTEQGIKDRIQLLDARILQIESDIAESGRLLSTGLVAQGTTLVPPVERFGGLSERAVTLFGLSFSFFFLLPVGLGLMKLMLRRARRGGTAPQAEVARLERLEQAVDAVALEVERVGESQRFQARVLAEANLMPALASGQPAAEPIRMREAEPVRSEFTQGRVRG